MVFYTINPFLTVSKKIKGFFLFFELLGGQKQTEGFHSNHAKKKKEKTKKG